MITLDAEEIRKLMNRVDLTGLAVDDAGLAMKLLMAWAPQQVPENPILLDESAELTVADS